MPLEVNMSLFLDNRLIVQKFIMVFIVAAWEINKFS
jgi:hypothetical protein